MRSWNAKYREEGMMWGEVPSECANAALAELEPSKTILDVGGGYGRDAVFLANNGFRVTVVDSSREAIRMAENLAKEKRTQAAFVEADVRALPFEGHSFDAVISNNTLNLFPLGRERTRIVGEMRRVLKEGGKAILVVPSTEDFEYGKKDRHFFTEGELRELFRDLKIRRLQKRRVTEFRAKGEPHEHVVWLLVAEKRARSNRLSQTTP